MTQLQVTRVYSRTAAEFSRTFKQEEADAWGILSQHSLADLEAAIERRRLDVTFDDFLGKPRCEIMPSAAELNYSIRKYKDDGIKLAAGKFVPCEENGCFDGWVQVPAGQWINAAGRPATNAAVKRCKCFLDYAAAKKGQSSGK